MYTNVGRAITIDMSSCSYHEQTGDAATRSDNDSVTVHAGATLCRGIVY